MTKKRRKNRFDFKQFSVLQEQTAMKVGTDGVLLGAWADVNGAKTVLDIGTGTGLIALMIAQRNLVAKIDAIEIDEKSFQEAALNSFLSPWADRITIMKGKVQEFSVGSTSKYDAIISNPPYFTAGTSSPVDTRHQARHHAELSQNELLDAVDKLLSGEGTFATILPVKEGYDFIDLALGKRLFLQRKMAFFAKQNKPQERWLLEFKKQSRPTEPEKEYLVQYDEKGLWTDAYKKLTKEFYLKV